MVAALQAQRWRRRQRSAFAHCAPRHARCVASPRALVLAAAATAAAVTLALLETVSAPSPLFLQSRPSGSRASQGAGRASIRGSWRSRLPLRAEADDAEEPVQSMLPELMRLAVTDKDELAATVDKNLAKIAPEDLSLLQAELERDPTGPPADVSAAIQVAVESRMATAKVEVEDLINNSKGDVNAQIKKTLKRQDSPLPLLMVLQMNIAQAQSAGEEDKMRALLHINTIIQEELEKKASRVRGMLNRLLRMDDPNIRGNILRHHLEPMEVAGAPDLDFGDDEPADSTPQLKAALVPPDRLASAIGELCAEVDRQLKLPAQGEAREEADQARFDTLEKIRTIAKEARMVIFELYGEAAMNTFGADLAPAFNTLMVRRQAAAQKAAEEAEASSSDTPGPGPSVPLPSSS